MDAILLCDFVSSIEVCFDESAACAELLREGIVGWVGEFAGRTGRGGEEDYGAGAFGGGEEGVEVGEEGYVVDFADGFREAVGG